MARVRRCGRGIVVVAAIVLAAIVVALTACGGRSPAPNAPRTPESSSESTRERTPAADARGSEVEATTTGDAQAEPPPELACGRCERVGDACGEWWEDGDDAGRTYAALIPCDPRCCR